MLFNRNKYNEVIEKLQCNNPEKIGIAFFDLNGLKQVNDEQGHKAGDSLIQNSASCISEVFSEKTFRIGGDEFIVIAQDIEKEKFLSMISDVRKVLSKGNINISIGASWSDKTPSISSLLKEADQKMYEEKRSYYENNNDRRNYRRKF